MDVYKLGFKRYEKMIIYGSNFKPGEVISFCGDIFVVLENYGNKGAVRENCPDGCIISPFYWEFEGEKAFVIE